MTINDKVSLDVGLILSLSESINQHGNLAALDNLDKDIINKRVINGDTLLHLAVRSENVEAVHKLLEIGADPAIKTKSHDRNAFHLVAINGNKDIFDQLKDKNPQAVKAKDKFGITPKTLAAQCKKSSIVREIKEISSKENIAKFAEKKSFVASYLESKTQKSKPTVQR